VAVAAHPSLYRDVELKPLRLSTCEIDIA